MKSLQARGWRCQIVTAAQSLDQGHLEKPCDVLVTDLEMPQLSAVESLRALRSHNAAGAIIVTRKFEEVSDISLLLREGAADVITCPENKLAIETAVERVLSTRSQKSFEQHLYNFTTDASITLVFKSQELAQHKVPIQFLEQLHASGRVDLTTRMRLELAFQEALANALEHGNLELPSSWREIIELDGRDKFSRMRQERLAQPEFGSREIRIQFEVCEHWFCIRIHDQGKGFIPQSAKQEITEVSTQPFGRGTAIIHGAIDEVSYNAQGNEIRMKKRISPGAAAQNRGLRNGA
jgi:anti-sigma regulatory factor (Ser/Thr protein kinase)